MVPTFAIIIERLGHVDRVIHFPLTSSDHRVSVVTDRPQSQVCVFVGPRSIGEVEGMVV